MAGHSFEMNSSCQIQYILKRVTGIHCILCKMKMKKSVPYSSNASMATRLFPGSWFSRFKERGSSGPETTHSVNKMRRGKLDFPSSYQSISTPGWKEGRFYDITDADDEAFWRFSFQEGSSCSDTEDESRHPWKEMEVPSFKDDVLPPYHECRTSKREARMLSQRKTNGSVRHSRKVRQGRANKRDAFAIESEKMEVKVELPDLAVSDSKSQQDLSFSNLSPCSGEEGLAFTDLNKDEHNSTPERASILDRQILEDGELKAARVKRKPACTSRRRSMGRKSKQSGEKAYSPQTEFKIRVLDDMEKARMKKKRERKAEVVYGKTVFDSFAVIKTSTNPWQDFKDSMVEMISEKGIKRPEELEELLASYLTLNCDGHHSLIIKVFLEVCYELNEDVH